MKSENLQRRWRALLRDIEKHAREDLGIEDPTLWLECDSGIYVASRNELGTVESSAPCGIPSLEDRRRIFTLVVSPGIDCGAW